MARKNKLWYSIVDSTPDMNGDSIRLVEIFDNRKDAEFVLYALELVNKYFNRYEIVSKEIL